MRTALRRLRGPSAERAVAGRIAPVSTTGFSLFTTRLRKNAVSSIVSVPCVITTPETSSRRRASSTAFASFNQTSEVIELESMFETWAASTSATSASIGTAESRSSTPSP